MFFWKRTVLSSKLGDLVSTGKNARRGGVARVDYQSLEPRQLMAGDLTSDALSFESARLSQNTEVVADNFGLDEARLLQLEAAQANDARIRIDLPTEFGNQLTLDIEIGGEIQTLQLERALSARGEDFRVLIQADDGSLIEFDAGRENNFVGTVSGIPGLSVRAVFSSQGLTAEATYADGRVAWNISPDGGVDGSDDSLHAVSLTDVFTVLESFHDHDGDGVADHSADGHGDQGGCGPGCNCPACSGAGAIVAEDVQAFDAVQEAASTETEFTQTAAIPQLVQVDVPNNPASRARVFNQAFVRQAVIGFDVTNEALREGYDDTSGPNSNNNQLDTAAEVDRAVQRVLDNISLFLTTDERAAPGTPVSSIYLRDGLVHQVAGLIIIRTSLAADPYAGQNGSAPGNADINGGLLSQFRDRWNGNADANGTGFQVSGQTSRAQSDHDLVTLLGGSAGTADGLAIVGTVNEFNRYSISDGSRADFWRSVARHEIGHTYGLPHFGGSGRRAEFDPAGNGIGIFDPQGLRNALTTDERATVLAEVNSSNLPLVNAGTANAGTFTEHNVRPVALRDDVQSSGNPIVIDVLANDLDANNDPLFLATFENTSDAGGTISVLVGQGDQGQDVLVYTPPQDFIGTDTFFYFAQDIPSFAGNFFRAFGQVSIDVTASATVDTSQTEFFYDLGAADSVLFDLTDEPYQILTASVSGDISFTGNTSNFDRGSGPGVNAINRDGVLVSNGTTFSHRVANGTYNVTFNVGDADFVRDNINVSAEGQSFFTDIDRSQGQFDTLRFDVSVTDGELNIEFEDFGGVNDDISITRIILRQTSSGVTVDTTQTQFFYDLGDTNSVLFNGNSDPYQILSPSSVGDIEFVGGNPRAFDRGATSGVNNINRDGVLVTGSTTFNHTLANGVWSVLVNIGDRNFARDNINVSAEGQTFFTDVDRAVQAFNPNLIFEVAVTDGQLNLNFNDLGGVNNDISITRIILERVGDLPEAASVESRQVFYNNSFFDGNDATANSNDDAAIATDKVALLPGQTASFSNYTSFDRGINGLFIDVNNLANASALSAADFILSTGNGSSLNDFSPLSVAPTLSVRAGEGAGGSDRVTLILPDGLVTRTWLSVTVVANENTGLSEDDLFYFGNVVGDTGDDTGFAIVNSDDESSTRNNHHNFTNRAGVEDNFDFNRDGLVTAIDESIVRNNNTTAANFVPLIVAPGSGSQAFPIAAFQSPQSSQLAATTEILTAPSSTVQAVTPLAAQTDSSSEAPLVISEVTVDELVSTLSQEVETEVETEVELTPLTEIPSISEEAVDNQNVSVGVVSGPTQPTTTSQFTEQNSDFAATTPQLNNSLTFFAEALSAINIDSEKTAAILKGSSVTASSIAELAGSASESDDTLSDLLNSQVIEFQSDSHGKTFVSLDEVFKDADVLSDLLSLNFDL